LVTDKILNNQTESWNSIMIQKLISSDIHMIRTTLKN